MSWPGAAMACFLPSAALVILILGFTILGNCRRGKANPHGQILMGRVARDSVPVIDLRAGAEGNRPGPGSP